jgi:DNA-binding HxlR family transcriptional regulator/predicted transcriptional regulator
MGTIQISRKGEKNQDLAGMLKSLEAECRSCEPTSPLECITRCQVYKLKNELRNLRETMDNPNYLKELFNVLKNETRFNILQAIVNGGCSIGQLRQMLKKMGDGSSQQNLVEEHLIPLIRAGLVTEKRDEYCTTMFGGRLTELLKNFSEYVQMLPAHSECYEETVLQTLLSGPKKFEEIEARISPKSTSRTLQRLRSTGLIETPTERDYVFFFKTIRDPNKETISPSERKVYDALVAKGSSVGKLAKDTGLSPRRTYKCVKVLKGKKLIFLRKTPKVYALTCKGEMLAWLLQEIQHVVEDTWMSSKQVVQTARLN